MKKCLLFLITTSIILISCNNNESCYVKDFETKDSLIIKGKTLCDKKVGFFWHFQNKRLFKLEYYINDKLFFASEFHPNGKIKTYRWFYKGELKGIQKTFFPNGNLENYFFTYKDCLHGKDLIFYENGKIKIIQNFMFNSRYDFRIDFDSVTFLPSRKAYFSNLIGGKDVMSWVEYYNRDLTIDSSRSSLFDFNIHSDSITITLFVRNLNLSENTYFVETDDLTSVLNYVERDLIQIPFKNNKLTLPIGNRKFLRGLITCSQPEAYDVFPINIDITKKKSKQYCPLNKCYKEALDSMPHLKQIYFDN